MPNHTSIRHTAAISAQSEKPTASGRQRGDGRPFRAAGFLIDRGGAGVVQRLTSIRHTAAVLPALMEYAQSFQNHAQGNGLSPLDLLRSLMAMPEEGELHPEFLKSNIHPSRMRS
jgi:hypothetical protein